MTVNLAAVAAARSELRAIVARWPELSTPAAHARLAGALPEVFMSRPIDPSRQSVQVGVRLSPDMAVAIDREVERLQGAALGATIGRSDAIRGIILRWMADQARALAPQASPPAQVEPESPAVPSSTPAPSPPARAPLTLVAPSPAPQAPSLVEPAELEPEVCDQCGVTIARTGCATPGCSAVVSVCGCSASDVRCPEHRNVVEPVKVSHPFAPPAQVEPESPAPLVLAPPPAAADEDSLRAKLRRLKASEEGTSVKARKWSNRKVADAVDASEATVRRWLSGENPDPEITARLKAYLRALPEV